MRGPSLVSLWILIVGADFSACQSNAKQRNFTLDVPLYVRKRGSPYSFLQKHHEYASSPEYSNVVYRDGGVSRSIGGQVVQLEGYPVHQYVGELSVGTPRQKRRVLFDTGSANIWIVDDHCRARTCYRSPLFHRKASTTFRLVKSANPISISFGTGKIKGHIAEDVVQLGSFKVADQRFGLVEAEVDSSKRHGIFSRIRFEGLVGLAFPELLDTGGTPLFDSIINLHKDIFPAFTFYLEPESHTRNTKPRGKMTIGKFDDTLLEAPFKYVDVIREHYWEVKLLELWLDRVKLCCDEPSYVIFDSGTTFNTIPSHEYQGFMELLSGDWVNTTPFPTVRYVLDGGVEIVIPPQNYMVEPHKPLRNQKPKPAFMQLDVPSAFGHAYIVGTYSVMSHYVTQFVRGFDGLPSRIGIATPAPSLIDQDVTVLRA